MPRVFLGVGSNEGDRLQQISQAVRALAAVPGIRVVQMAMITETEPVGGPSQEPYLNTAVELETSLEPAALLAALKAIERGAGRKPTGERWGPRPIDLDILLYEARVLNTAELTVPHPRLHERRFVLEPLAQLAADAVHPVLHETIGALRARLEAATQ